jgi:hypothetical protein
MAPKTEILFLVLFLVGRVAPNMIEQNDQEMDIPPKFMSILKTFETTLNTGKVIKSDIRLISLLLHFVEKRLNALEQENQGNQEEHAINRITRE